MAFKIWGKSELLSESDLKTQLEILGIEDVVSLISFIVKKGCAVVGGTKIMALKFK